MGDTDQPRPRYHGTTSHRLRLMTQRRNDAMIAPLIFIFVLLIIGFIVPASIAHGRRVDAIWSEAAATLGLGFQPSGLFQRRRIAGTASGLHITLDTYARRSGKQRHTYTRLEVGFPVSLGLGLRLTRSGFVSVVARIFGAQDIEVGDGGFDGVAVVKGVDAQKGRAFLTPARRARIYRLLSNFTDASIDDHAIHWQQRGVMTDLEHMVGVVRRFKIVAWHLVGDRRRDRVLSDAIEAADLGNPGEALASLEGPIEEVDDAGESVPHDVEEDIIRGHLLHLAGRDEASQAAFSAAAEKAPEDEEAVRWSQRLLQHRPAAAAAPERDATLTVDELCEAVFRPEGTSFEANRRFERQFQGQRVAWEGCLKKVEPYGYDLVFEQRDACKGSFEVTEADSSPFARREVLAVVQLPAASTQRLSERVGESMRFSGRLFRIDSFHRNIYVEDGRIES